MWTKVFPTFFAPVTFLYSLLPSWLILALLQFLFPSREEKEREAKKWSEEGGGNTGVWGEVSPVGRLARKGKKKKLASSLPGKLPNSLGGEIGRRLFLLSLPCMGNRKGGRTASSRFPPSLLLLTCHSLAYLPIRTVVQFALPPFPQSCHLPSFLFPKCIHWKGFFACRCLEPVSDKPLSCLQNVHKANTQK